MPVPDLDEEYRELRESARKFAERHIDPVARDYNQESRFPRDVIEAAAEQGFVADMIPESYGGANRDTLGSAIVTEEMWRSDPAIGFALDLVSFPSNLYILSNYADEWMKEELFPEIAAGELINSIAVTEPNHGSDVGGIETAAEKDGDEWVIDGHKKYVGNATVADVHLLLAKTDPSAGVRGISAFLVPGDADCITTEQLDEKMGMHASDWGEIKLDGVRIPEKNLVGEENKGFYYFMEALPRARSIVAAQGVGAAQGVLDHAQEYATDREQFDQPVSEFQAIRHKFAEMSTDIEVARSMTYRAAEHAERNTDEANTLASTAKLFSSEMSVDVADEGVQIFGASGYLAENDVERFFRAARATKIYEGTSEIQKNIIAKEVLYD